VKAASGEQAMALLATRPVDLVLLDVMLPGLGGHEVLRAVRADPKTAALPVIVFSAVGDPELRDYLMREGASDYWVKGQVDYGTLERRLATYLATQ
jgi:CheY-like chemotaxis protein